MNSSGSNFTPLDQQPLGHTIATVLSEAIISGQLRPGAPMVQSELAAQFGVSRAPLREALNKLSEDGLVVNVPYKGTIVAPLNRSDVEELRSLRIVLERFAASLLIERVTQEQLAELEAIFSEMRSAADHGDDTKFALVDLQLHTKICEFSGHELLFEVWQMYARRFRRVLSLRNQVNRDLQKLVEMHVPLLEALRDRDIEQIDAFYADHGADLTKVLIATWPEDHIDIHVDGGEIAKTQEESKEVP